MSSVGGLRLNFRHPRDVRDGRVDGRRAVDIRRAALFWSHSIVLARRLLLHVMGHCEGGVVGCPLRRHVSIRARILGIARLAEKMAGVDAARRHIGCLARLRPMGGDTHWLPRMRERCRQMPPVAQAAQTRTAAAEGRRARAAASCSQKVASECLSRAGEVGGEVGGGRLLGSD